MQKKEQRHYVMVVVLRRVGDHDYTSAASLC